jgi:hypothetical protein
MRGVLTGQANCRARLPLSLWPQSGWFLRRFPGPKRNPASPDSTVGKKKEALLAWIFHAMLCVSGCRYAKVPVLQGMIGLLQGSNRSSGKALRR